jgi:hypothetical protein
MWSMAGASKETFNVRDGDAFVARLLCFSDVRLRHGVIGFRRFEETCSLRRKI